MFAPFNAIFEESPPREYKRKLIKSVGSIEDATMASEIFGIPMPEVVFCEMNRTGVSLELHQVPVKFRVRFLCDEIFSNKSPMFFALPVKNSRQTKFRVDKNSSLFFNHSCIGDTTNVELDTCDCSYFRKNKRVLNLNSNRRGDCFGCTFCIHNYTLYDNRVLKDDRKIIDKDSLKNFLEKEIMPKNGFPDLGCLEQIAIVTGLFGQEDLAVKHIVNVRKVAEALGFRGTIFYLGCELLSKKSFEILKDYQPISLCYSIDCFDHREEFMVHKKGKITLINIAQALGYALNRGFEATFSYIVGLDSLESMAKNVEFFSRYVNRFPIVNIYQTQHSQQRKNMTPEATHLEYFLKARKLFEQAFAGRGLYPRNWENYRSLWYHKFNSVDLLE